MDPTKSPTTVGTKSASLVTVDKDFLDTLFTAPEGFQFGRSGDAVLWQKMKEHFLKAPPADLVAFRDQLEKLFLSLTGHTIYYQAVFFHQQFVGTDSSDGAGYIDPKFWRERGKTYLGNKFDNLQRDPSQIKKSVVLL